MTDEGSVSVPQEVLSVSALNRAVAQALAHGFRLLRVRGELANFTRAASGHWYFTLKDEAAQVRCVMFRGRSALVEFAPRDGDAVEVLAQVSLYEPRGEYQLAVEGMRRAGQGRLFEEFLRLKEKLAAQGLFDTAAKRALPRVPRAIGVVTSPQAAALRDVLSALARRAPYVRVILYPVPVQGPGAGERIAQMLATASRRHEVDVVLLVRGGGSIEDLWAFNEEAVARAVRACRIPVVVGVGHESDVTIADFAADLRAPTPTAAAELAAPAAAALREAVDAAWGALRRDLRRRLDAAHQRLDYARRALASPRAPLAAMHVRLERLVARLRGQPARLSGLRLRLLHAAQALERQRPAPSVRAERIAAQAAALAAAVRARLAQQAARVEALQRALGHLDPGAVLQRGYAIALDAGGRALADARAVAPGAAVRVVLARGALQTRVERIEKPQPSQGGDGSAAD